MNTRRFEIEPDPPAMEKLRARLCAGNFELSRDAHTCVHLLLEWFYDYPGGIVRSIVSLQTQVANCTEMQQVTAIMDHVPPPERAALMFATSVLGSLVNEAQPGGISMDSMTEVIGLLLQPLPSTDDSLIFAYFLLNSCVARFGAASKQAQGQMRHSTRNFPIARSDRDTMSVQQLFSLIDSIHANDGHISYDEFAIW